MARQEQNAIIKTDFLLGTAYVSGDDGYELYLNGNLIGKNTDGWEKAEEWPLTFREGENTLIIKALNDANGTHPGAAIAEIQIGDARIVSDTSWLQNTFLDESEVLGTPSNNEGWLNSVEYGDVESVDWWNRPAHDTLGVSISESGFPPDSSAKWIYSEGFITDSVVFLKKNINIELIEPTSGSSEINGTNKRDTLVGTEFSDTIKGEGGSDKINAGASSDTIYGGAGNDAIWGEAGDDIIDGGAGKNRLYGGDGSDTFVISGGKKNVIKDFNLDEGDKIQIDYWDVKTLRSNKQGTAIIFNNKDKLILTGMTPEVVLTSLDILAY